MFQFDNVLLITVDASLSDNNLKFFPDTKTTVDLNCCCAIERLWLPKDIKKFCNSLHYNLAVA
jgi:hypothetical protein